MAVLLRHADRVCRPHRSASHARKGALTTSTQIVVTALGAGAIVWVLWYFLFSRGKAVAATPGTEGIQEVRITVKGGYTPDTIVVQAGKPVRLQFYRDETADCSERVVFERFGIDTPLPPFQTTTIEFTPDQPGEYLFRCGMNMLKGLLVVEPAGDRRAASSPHKFHGAGGPGGRGGGGAHE